MLLRARKVVPMALFTPSEGKNKRGKRQNERGKTRNFLIYFVKILVKKQENWGREKRNMCCSYNTKHGTNRENGTS